MFKLLGKIPEKFYVAVSGGIDSMVLLDFLLNGRHEPQGVLYFDHGTEYGKDAKAFLKGYCAAQGLDMIVGHLSNYRKKDESLEEYWRNERYKFFDDYDCVMTAHHLDDVLEWWIFSSLHGQSKLIPYKRNNIIRPFLRVPKSKIKIWAARRNMDFVDDPSNENTKFMRNHIRHNMVEQALVVNPGLRGHLSRKVEQEYINNHVDNLQDYYQIDDATLYCI